MAITGNKGEWSEPYALLKLLADGKLFLGDENFEKVKNVFYPILKVLRHEKNRTVDFSYDQNLVVINNGKKLFKIAIKDFITNAALCFKRINEAKKGKGAFAIPEIENFLSSFSITTLKAKSKLKNDITIQIEDPNTFISPTLGFSIKSQLGRASTLLNASGPTNFTYRIVGHFLTKKEIDIIKKEKVFSTKIELIKKFGATLEFENVENEIFKSNLQTIDYYFDKILSQVVYLYYENKVSSANTVSNFIKIITTQNPLNYKLKVNPEMYSLMMKKFLTDYALGMRAGEVWKREYQATGGYLIVRADGELVCYNFYFAKAFENYLYSNTKLETPDKRLRFIQKMEFKK
jgi:type II restriction enzyme